MTDLVWHQGHKFPALLVIWGFLWTSAIRTGSHKSKAPFNPGPSIRSPPGAQRFSHPTPPPPPPHSTPHTPLSLPLCVKLLLPWSTPEACLCGSIPLYPPSSQSCSHYMLVILPEIKPWSRIRSEDMKGGRSTSTRYMFVAEINYIIHSGTVTLINMWMHPNCTVHSNGGTFVCFHCHVQKNSQIISKQTCRWKCHTCMLFNREQWTQSDRHI